MGDRQKMKAEEQIEVYGARVHNLKYRCQYSAEQSHRYYRIKRQRQIVIGIRYYFCRRAKALH